MTLGNAERMIHEQAIELANQRQQIDKQSRAANEDLEQKLESSQKKLEEAQARIHELEAKIRHLRSSAMQLRLMENALNEFYESDFRSHQLRPKNAIRKLTTRRFPWLEFFLPEPRMGVDSVHEIGKAQNRVSILKAALEKKIFNSAKYLCEHPELLRTKQNPFSHYLENGWPQHQNPKSSPKIKTFLDSDLSEKRKSDHPHFRAKNGHQNDYEIL